MTCQPEIKEADLGKIHKLFKFIELLGAFVFGSLALWVNLLVTNYATQEISITRFIGLVVIACVTTIVGGFIVVLAMRPNLLQGKKKTEPYKKTRSFSADKIMIIASVIAIASLAVYIYISEVLGVKG